MTARIPTPRADAIAAKWGKSHPLYRQMLDLDRQDRRDAEALARHPKPCLHCHLIVTSVGALLAISEADWQAGDRLHARDFCTGPTGQHATT